MEVILILWNAFHVHGSRLSFEDAEKLIDKHLSHDYDYATVQSLEDENLVMFYKVFYDYYGERSIMAGISEADADNCISRVISDQKEDKPVVVF